MILLVVNNIGIVSSQILKYYSKYATFEYILTLFDLASQLYKIDKLKAAKYIRFPSYPIGFGISEGVQRYYPRGARMVKIRGPLGNFKYEYSVRDNKPRDHS